MYYEHSQFHAYLWSLYTIKFSWIFEVTSKFSFSLLMPRGWRFESLATFLILRLISALCNLIPSSQIITGITLMFFNWDSINYSYPILNLVHFFKKERFIGNRWKLIVRYNVYTKEFDATLYLDSLKESMLTFWHRFKGNVGELSVTGICEQH